MGTIPREDVLKKKTRRILRENLPTRGIRGQKLAENAPISAHADEHYIEGNDPLNPSRLGAADKGHLHSFLSLLDSPATYSGGSAKVVAVKGDESGVEFISQAGGSTHGTATHTEFAAHKMFYSNAGGDQQEVSLGGSGSALISQGPDQPPAFGPMGAGAPAGAQYLTLALSGDLSAERVFAPGTALSAVDGGANGTYTLNHAVHSSGNLHPEYQGTSQKGSPSGYMGLGTGSRGAQSPKLHKADHISGGADSFYSVHQYVFFPDAGPGSAVETGDQQGAVLVSGPGDELVKRITTNMGTANTGSAGTVEIEFGSGDDLDTISWGTAIDTVTLGTGQLGVVGTSGFNYGTIPAQRLIRYNVNAVGATNPMEDVETIVEVWRPLQA